MKLNRLLALSLLVLLAVACNKKESENTQEDLSTNYQEKFEFGYNLNNLFL